MLINCHYMTHIIDMLIELNWMTVKERAGFHSTCLIYKCQNNLAPQYFVDHFNNISQNYNTRSSTHGDIKGMEHVPNIFISFDKYLFLEVINILF